MSAVIDRGARAVADVTDGLILATVEIAAPVERVFRALSSDEIVHWWGSSETYRTTEWRADVRPGGRWQARGVGADGKPFGVEGEYLEIEPPHKLVQTWKYDWDGGHSTKLTYRLEPIDGGTRVTVRHEGFGGHAESCRAHGSGWSRVLEWLAAHVSPPPVRDERRYFLCRLLAPRPTFTVDMTAAEQEVMRNHAAYWRDLLRKDVAVVFGPVADPGGAWGVGIVRADDEERVQALRDGDPVILSGRGFSYEILPMLRAVVRDEPPSAIR
jgi:uncharacterized protein YndB with AHSA1/START domain